MGCLSQDVLKRQLLVVWSGRRVLLLWCPSHCLSHHVLGVEVGEDVPRLLNDATGRTFALTLAPLALELAQIIARHTAVLLAVRLSIAYSENLLLG